MRSRLPVRPRSRAAVPAPRASEIRPHPRRSTPFRRICGGVQENRTSKAVWLVRSGRGCCRGFRPRRSTGGGSHGHGLQMAVVKTLGLSRRPNRRVDWRHAVALPRRAQAGRPHRPGALQSAASPAGGDHGGDHRACRQGDGTPVHCLGLTAKYLGLFAPTCPVIASQLRPGNTGRSEPSVQPLVCHAAHAARDDGAFAIDQDFRQAIKP